MRIVKSVNSLRRMIKDARRKGLKAGFVPTMGYLHEGHLRLMRQAKKECGLCVVSIFVNPKQFGPREDLKQYPRDLKRDASMCVKENVDILFVPSDNTVYPKCYLTYIDVEKVARRLCGAFRPGHFRGVATVVAKLLNMVAPDVLYLGQKDAQQAVVIKTMVQDLNVPVKVKVVPTVREPDGLALSSRNVFLSLRQRQEAVVLSRSLRWAAHQVKAGQRGAARITAGIKRLIAACSGGKVQYVECVDFQNLEPLKVLKGTVLIAVAVLFGRTRLIDNVIISIHEPRQVKN